MCLWQFCYLFSLQVTVVYCFCVDLFSLIFWSLISDWFVMSIHVFVRTPGRLATTLQKLMGIQINLNFKYNMSEFVRDGPQREIINVLKVDSFYSLSWFKCVFFFQAYAKFSGAKVTVSPIDWTWKTLTGGLQLSINLNYIILWSRHHMGIAWYKEEFHDWYRINIYGAYNCTSLENISISSIWSFPYALANKAPQQCAYLKSHSNCNTATAMTLVWTQKCARKVWKIQI